MKYQRIHSIVDAIKYTGDNLEEVGVFTNNAFQVYEIPGSTRLEAGVWDSFTGEILDLNTQEYVIRDTENGGFFVLDGDYFERFFEVVE